MIWTPLLVVATAWFGEAVATHLLNGIKTGVVGFGLTAIGVLGAMRLAGRAFAQVVLRYHQRFDQTIEIPI